LSAHATFDLAQGLLRLAPATLDVLLGPPGRERNGAEPHLAALREAGVLGPEGIHPEVEAALAPMQRPVCELVVRDGGRPAEGWMASNAVTFVVAGDDGLADVSVLHPSLLPWTLAALVELGPRRRSQTAAKLRLGRADLERLLGSRDPEAGRGSAREEAPEEVERALDALAGARRWRAEARWSGPGGQRSERAVEAIDTDAGLWLIEPDGSELSLRPVTSTTAWRLLIRLPPRSYELGPEPRTVGAGAPPAN